MRIRLLSFLLLVGVLALAGCSSRSGTTMPLLPQAMPMDPPEGSGMLSLNTYAGDALAQMLLLRMGSGSGILAASFVDLDDMNRTSAFGRLASQQIASRIGQHGFRMLEARVASLFRMDRQGEYMLTRDAAQLLSAEYDAGAVLVGVYKVAEDRVFVSARVVRLADNVLLGAYEYYMPMNNDVRALLAGGSSGSGAGQSAGAGGNAAGPGSPGASGGSGREYDVWSRYDSRGGVRNPGSVGAAVQAPLPDANGPSADAPAEKDTPAP